MKSFFPALLLLALPAMAATTPPAKLEPEGYTWLSDDAYAKLKKEAQQRSKRQIASNVEIQESQMSPELRAFRNSFIAVTTPQQLDQLLENLDKDYSKHPDDLKFVAASLIPMRAMRGFTYRTHPLANQLKNSHTMVMTRFLNTGAFLKINLPTEQWRVGFSYITEPLQEKDLNRISTPAGLQDYVAQELYPAFAKATSRISALNLRGHEVVWDNQLLYGTASFQDGFNRYRIIGEAEKTALLAGLHSGMAAMARMQAYNIDDAIPFAQEVGNLYGFDSFLSAVDGVTTANINTVIRKPRYSKLFTLRDNGAANMQTAFRHAKEASRLGNLSWQELKNRSDREELILRGSPLMAFSTDIDQNVQASEDVFAGPTTIRSDITGEMITVDIPGLYNNAPQDLKKLFPTTFDNAPGELNHKVQMKDGSMRQVKFRNYYRGRPTGWDQNAYRSLFPELKKGTEVGQYVRIVNQSRGTAVIAEHLHPFMLY